MTQSEQPQRSGLRAPRRRLSALAIPVVIGGGLALAGTAVVPPVAARAVVCTPPSFTTTVVHLSGRRYNPSDVGYPVGFTVSVTPCGPGTPTGMVTLSDTFPGAVNPIGTAALSGGNATFSLNLAQGVHSIVASYPGDGTFDPSTSVAFSQEIITVPDWFVENLYKDVLGRTAEPTGEDFWIARINRGVSRSDVALDIESSLEFDLRDVGLKYSTILGRTADSGGLQAYAGMMQAGLRDEGLVAILTASDEFYNGNGATPSTWLDGVYQQVLGRAADTGGKAFWLDHMTAGMSRFAVALNIASSDEAASRLVGGWYTTFLLRGADSGGLAFWAGRLGQGWTDEQVQAMLIGSDEYLGRTRPIIPS